MLFAFIGQHSTLKLAAVAALAVSGAIALPSLLKGRPKLLELGAILAFAGFTFAAFNVDPTTSEWVARYARGIAAALLSLIAFGSLLFVPFTAQYARESVPRQFWSSPRFKQINRQLTTMWALVFATMVPAHVIAGAIDTHRVNLIFNWAIPVVLIMWAAKRTASASDDAGEEGPMTNDGFRDDDFSSKWTAAMYHAKAPRVHPQADPQPRTVGSGRVRLDGQRQRAVMGTGRSQIFHRHVGYPDATVPERPRIRGSTTTRRAPCISPQAWCTVDCRPHRCH